MKKNEGERVSGVFELRESARDTLKRWKFIRKFFSWSKIIRKRIFCCSNLLIVVGIEQNHSEDSILLKIFFTDRGNEEKEFREFSTSRNYVSIVWSFENQSETRSRSKFIEDFFFFSWNKIIWKWILCCSNFLIVVGTDQNYLGNSILLKRIFWLSRSISFWEIDSPRRRVNLKLVRK